MFHTRNDNKTNPLYLTVSANGKPLKMEVDTGAGVSIISEETYHRTWEDDQAPTIQSARIKLRTYTGELVAAVGRLQVKVEHSQEQLNLPLVVARGSGPIPTLLGRDWLARMKLDWRGLFHIRAQDPLARVLDAHKAVSQNELGAIQRTKAKVHVNSNVAPKFCKPRPVPFSLRKKVEDELERLEKEGIIRKKQFSEWAAPI